MPVCGNSSRFAKRGWENLASLAHSERYVTPSQVSSDRRRYSDPTQALSLKVVHTCCLLSTKSVLDCTNLNLSSEIAVSLDGIKKLELNHDLIATIHGEGMCKKFNL